MFVCKPKSRKNIQDECLMVRRALGIADGKCVPIVPVLEHVIPMVFDDFTFAVVSDEDLPDAEAKANPATKSIRARESVYLDATRGDGRARFTLAHELGHLLTLEEIPDDHPKAGYFRSERHAPTKAYMDPEWQASEFAADFLAPFTMVAGLDPFTVADVFGVSLTVAGRQLGKAEAAARRMSK